MAYGREIAAKVFPYFMENVLDRTVLTYGHYAKIVGRDPATEAVTIGPAMHIIGYVCVIRQVPIAPLHFVRRESGDAKQVFASDPVEASVVLKHFETLLVAAREYAYTREELETVGRALSEVLLKKVGPGWTPHHLWHGAILHQPKDCQSTYFERALARYEKLIEDLRKTRAGG